eukprot:246920_1
MTPSDTTDTPINDKQITFQIGIKNKDKKSDNKDRKERPFGLGVKFFYWVWVTWNMSAIYGLLIIHIWDIGTDIAVMIKWYEDGRESYLNDGDW